MRTVEVWLIWVQTRKRVEGRGPNAYRAQHLLLSRKIHFRDQKSLDYFSTCGRSKSGSSGYRLGKESKDADQMLIVLSTCYCVEKDTIGSKSHSRHSRHADDRTLAQMGTDSEKSRRTRTKCLSCSALAIE